MYYRRPVDRLRMNVFLVEQFDTPRSFITGKPVAPPDRLPLEYVMEVDVDESPVMIAFFPHVNVMHARLVHVLAAAGVDNLQVFSARITDPNTNTTYDDYFAVNVVGLVECADMARSDHAPLADLFFFYKLVIIPGKARGLSLFRLAESPIDIIVHERVARAIRNSDFPELVLQAVMPA